MTIAIELEKKSVTLPKSDVASAQERAGKGGFSAYLAEALALKLQRDSMLDEYARMEAKHGPVDEAEVERVMRLMEQ